MTTDFTSVKGRLDVYSTIDDGSRANSTKRWVVNHFGQMEAKHGAIAFVEEREEKTEKWW